MEDNLQFLIHSNKTCNFQQMGRHPKFFNKLKMTSIFQQNVKQPLLFNNMGDNLTFKQNLMKTLKLSTNYRQYDFKKWIKTQFWGKMIFETRPF